MQNLDQLRAKNAFTFIKKVLDDPSLDKKQKEEISNRLCQLPVMFHTNGLLATYAFLFKKNEIIAEEVTEHLRRISKISSTDSAQNIFRDNWLNNENFTTADFFNITDELIKYSNWLKRAAEALMPN